MSFVQHFQEVATRLAEQSDTRFVALVTVDWVVVIAVALVTTITITVTSWAWLCKDISTIASKAGKIALQSLVSVSWAVVIVFNILAVLSFALFGVPEPYEGATRANDYQLFFIFAIVWAFPTFICDIIIRMTKSISQFHVKR